MAGPLCALVVGRGATPVEVERVVVVFPDPAEADEFARRHGLTDAVVAPVDFAVLLDAANPAPR